MDMKGVFGRSNHILNDRVVQKQSLMVFAANPKGLVLYFSYAQGVSDAGRKFSGLIFWVKFADLSSELFL